jgi:transcriptional regulator with XRE-family HTH domain
MAGIDERSILARNVKALRLQRGFSQEELAARAGGIRQAAVSEIEAAKGNPTFTTLEFVAAALGVTIRDLLKPTRER